MTVSYTGDAGATLDQITKLDQAEYDKVYRPINREMIASTNSTSLVDAAKAKTNNYFEQGQARQNRMSDRFGLNFNALESSENTRRSTASKALNYDDVVNRSRLQQYDRNVSVRNDMIAVGRDIDNSAYTQLAQAAGLQTRRENANTALSAQNDAARSQNMASGAMAGASMAYAAGMGAGPIGWAALAGAALFSLF